MQTKKTRATRGTKLLKRVTTVSDLFTRDDVNDILAYLNKDKDNIKDLVVIYTDRTTGAYSWTTTEDTLESMVVWLLESLKRDIMSHEDEA